MRRLPDLKVTPAHRADCTFGKGFYRIYLGDGEDVYCQTESEVRRIARLVPAAILHVERDGYCLDGDRQGDANTPDVVDAEQWLHLPRAEAMALVGLESEADYMRVYDQVQAAVTRRGNRESQLGVHVPIVIKKRGRPVIDV